MFVALSVVLMTMDHRQQHIESLRASLSIVIYPLQMIVELPGAAYGWFSESLAMRRQLQEDNASLRTQILMLKAQT